MDIGEFLRAQRQALDLSQARVAALSGMAASRISGIETGAHSPTWATVERLLEGMGRRPVLDVRLLDDGWEDPADARVGAMGIDERFRLAVPLAGLALDKLQRRGARVALDGPTAATLLGERVESPFVHVAVPEEDADDLVAALADGAAQGWSERFRDFRGGIDDADQLVAPEPTRWLVRGVTVSVRLVSEWAPTMLSIADREVAVMGLEALRKDRAVASVLARPS